MGSAWRQVALTVFLSSLGAMWIPGSAGAQPVAPTEPSLDPGLRIINSLALGNCGSCHALPGQTGVRSSFGPSLEGVGSRWGREALRQWVTDPRVMRPQTLMPAFGTLDGLTRAWPNQPILTPEQIDSVVNTLQTWR
jgi:sulfur-oxidizing protein SoxX